MGLFREKEPFENSPDYTTSNEYGGGVEYDDDLSVECPPHTTERKLVARIDFHVIPFLCIMYRTLAVRQMHNSKWTNARTVLAFSDRINIGNASIFGLPEDLELTGHQYNVALAIFFVPYCLFEIPSNILLKKFKPHVWLSINMFLFGFVTIMQGLVKSYGGLLTTRFFLGLFETGKLNAFARMGFLVLHRS